MKMPDINELILVAVVIVNAIATGYVYADHTPEREDKLWSLYTGSVVGLYGNMLAGERKKYRSDKE